MPKDIVLSPNTRATNAAQTIERSQGFLQSVKVCSAVLTADGFDVAPSALTRAQPSALRAPRPAFDPCQTFDDVSGAGRELAIAPGFLSFQDSGELVVASSQPHADRSVDRSSPELLACIELLEALHDCGRVKALLTGLDAKSYRTAAAAMLVEFLTMRAQHQMSRLPPAQRQPRDTTLLRAFKQLVAIGLPRDTLVSTTIAGVPQTVQLSCLATYLHDAEALDLLFAQPLSTDLPANALIEDPSDMMGRQHFVDGLQERGNAGRLLGFSMRYGHHSSVSAEAIAEKWDDFLLRSMSPFKPEELHIERLGFAACSATENFALPLQNLIERFVQLPMPQRSAAIRRAYDYVLEYQLSASIDRLVKQSALWNHRNKKNFCTCHGIASGPTPVHALAESTYHSEIRALQLLEDAAEAGANFLAVSQFAPTMENVLQIVVPVRASLHAAISARPRLAHALLAHEYAAQIDSNDTVLADLTRVIADSASLLEASDQYSMREYLSRLQAPLDALGQLFLENGLVDASHGHISSQCDKAASSLQELMAVVRERLEEIPILGDAGNDSDLDAALQKTPDWRAGSLTVRYDTVKKCKNSAEIKFAVTQSFRSLLDEMKQLLHIRLHKHSDIPSDADRNRWIGAESFLDRQKTDRVRGLTYLAMTNQVAALEILLTAPTPMEAHDLASAFAWALVLAKGRNEAARNTGQAMTEIFRTANMTDLSLWGMLHAAVELRDSSQVTQIVKRAQKTGVTLDLLQGPYASYVIRNAALTSNASFKAVLSCLDDKASQRRLFEAADEAGDTLYHIVARCGGRVLETLSKKSGFCPEGLIDTQNASQLTAMEEACRVGSESTLALLWRKSAGWGLTDRLDTTLVETARGGSVSGLLALASIAPREPRVSALLEKSLTALEATAFSAQRQQVADVLTSWQCPQNEARAALSDVSLDPWSPSALRLGQRAMEHDDAKSASSTQASSALLAQYDSLRQAHSSGKVEESLARFDAVQRASALEPATSDNELEICKHVLYNLEQRFFGQYFGRHFFAHRASVSDEQLLLRLMRLQNYGSSRFGYDDAPAILRVRQKAIQAAKAYEGAQKHGGKVATGLFAIHLSDSGIRGSGFTLAGPTKDATAFCDSTVVRFLIRLFPNGESPQVVSMYPVPLQGRHSRCFEHLMAVST